MPVRPSLLLFCAACHVAFPQALDGCFPVDAATPDRSNLYLLCENGIGLRRGETGSWETLHLPGGGRVRAAHFVKPDRGFVAGDAGLLLTTSDGGRTWGRLETGAREDLTAVQAMDGKIWVAGFNGTILHSADGGRTWRPQRTFTSRPIQSLHFVDESRGWAAGWSGLLLRTTDGGESWQSLDLPGVWETLSFIRFRDAQNGWVVGMYGTMLRTRNGGKTWERQAVPTKSWLTSLDFSPDGAAWLAAGYQLLRSDDGGETWRTLPHESAMAVTRVVAARDSVFAFGPGFLLTRSPGQSSWMRTNLDELVQPAGREMPPREKAGVEALRGPS